MQHNCKNQRRNRQAENSKTMVVDAMVALANPSQAKNNKLVSLAKSVDKDNDGLMDLQNPD